jgi:phosphoglycerol transferase MdoB-like AlkP superfamily enzyme
MASLSRVLLVNWLFERVIANNGLLFVLLQGVRFDLVALGLLLAIPMTLTPLASAVRPLHRPWMCFVRIYLATVIGFWVLLEVATPPFIMEYDIRPNLLFVEYLKYSREVFSMLFVGYKTEMLAALVLVPAIMWPVWSCLKKLTTAVPQSVGWSALPLAFLVLVTCAAAARSTLDHRPVNPSTVAFSSDTLVNSLPLNSLYSVAYAVYELSHEDEGFPYGEVDAAASIAEEREAIALPPESFLNDQIPTLHYQSATQHPDKPLNLVIIVEESLGAEFVGALGGLPLTPNIDRWANNGIWLERLYATGTRSARGLEAILTGFPPTTSQSVLKLGKAQRDFFTLGRYLGQKGYDTSFIYGGEAQFDNMKRFFANNGFSTVIDKHDFVNPVFYGSWGASDEDVFDNAHAKFLAQDPDTPFFSVLFTTSNHSPWEYPDGRIELYDAEKATVNNAVKYANHALGQYLDKASNSPYWHNTVFLVVSDHNSRVYGAEYVPVERFHIPGLIVGGTISPKRFGRLARQIDLLPTMLSLIGVSGSHPAPGMDLTRPDLEQLPARTIMQYGDTQAYRENDRIVVLRKGGDARMYDYRDEEFREAPQDPEIIRKAQALAAWPVRAYRERQYRLPVNEPSLGVPM